MGLLPDALDDVAGVSEYGAGAWAFEAGDDSGEVVLDYVGEASYWSEF